MSFTLYIRPTGIKSKLTSDQYYGFSTQNEITFTHFSKTRKYSLKVTIHPQLCQTSNNVVVNIRTTFFFKHLNLCISPPPPHTVDEFSKVHKITVNIYLKNISLLTVAMETRLMKGFKLLNVSSMKFVLIKDEHFNYVVL